MNLSINNTQGMCLLLAEGAIEENDLNRIAAELEKLPVNQEKYIMLDCVDLKGLIYGSVGFSGLINQLLSFKARNTKIILFGYDTLTYRLLKLLKLDEMFHYSHSLDEAYLILNKSCKESVSSATG